MKVGWSSIRLSPKSNQSADMDIDQNASQGRSRKSGRIHKRHSNRKNRSSIVFQTKPKKSSKRR